RCRRLDWVGIGRKPNRHYPGQRKKARPIGPCLTVWQSDSLGDSFVESEAALVHTERAAWRHRILTACPLGMGLIDHRPLAEEVASLHRERSILRLCLTPARLEER